jgi:hypothetical protein
MPPPPSNFEPSVEGLWGDRPGPCASRSALTGLTLTVVVLGVSVCGITGLKPVNEELKSVIQPFKGVM